MQNTSNKELPRTLHMSQVDEMICDIIRRANRWMTIERAFDAWFHAKLMWDQLENERAHLSGEKHAQSARQGGPYALSGDNP